MPCGVGGGTHRSWPGGRGGRPRALIPRGRGQGRVGLVGGKTGWVHRTWLGGRGVREAGQGLGGGARASVPGGRDTGPRDGANFVTCVVFLRTKRRKLCFLKDALWGGGGVPTGAGLVDGGVDQGPWLQEGWGGRRGDGSSKEGGGLGLGWLFQRGASPGKGSGNGWLGGRGGCKGFGCGGVGGRGTGPRDGANSAMFTVPCDALNTA